jgi:deferrochelatase/peroxidase EfeB
MGVDVRGVQAPVLHLYRSPIVRHLLLRFAGEEGARRFVRTLTPRVTMADVEVGAAPDPLLNVGLTSAGLTALGLAPEILDDLDREYCEGPDAGALGDVPGSASDPATWWEGRFASADVHCVVHLHVRSDEALERASKEVRDLARACDVAELCPRRDGSSLDGRALGDRRVHFGYRDGLSQPDVSWDDVPDTPTEINFRNFLLGYATDDYPSAPLEGPAADLVRGSVYGVFRWIYQDVAGFERFLRSTGPAQFPDLPPERAAELLAAKLMGRWRDGTPLVLSPDGPAAELAERRDFGYATADPDGRRCPFSAHIRVVNPRDQALDPVVVDGVPRVLRRGMPYGPPLAGSDDDGQDRGLLGLFLCADIRLQVYTLTSWIRRNAFSPVFAANRRVQEALVANRAEPGIDLSFTIPAEGGAKVIPALPDFVRTKGTLLLLYPSHATLGALAPG